MDKNNIAEKSQPLMDWAREDTGHRAVVILAFETDNESDLESVEAIVGDEDILVPALATKKMARTKDERSFTGLMNRAARLILEMILDNHGEKEASEKDE